MLEFILHPIQSTRTLRYIASHITPEHKAEIDAAETELEKAVIKDRILREIFPDLA